MSVITSSASLRFDGARAGTARATYGQRAMVGFVDYLGAEGNRLTVRRTVPIPPGCTLGDVLAVLAELPLRHEALRTRIRTGDGGELWQELPGSGEIPVELWDVVGSDPEPVGRQAEQLLSETHFDLRHGWPIRLLVGSVEGVPTAVLMATSHVATDLQSARIVATATML